MGNHFVWLVIWWFWFHPHESFDLVAGDSFFFRTSVLYNDAIASKVVRYTIKHCTKAVRAENWSHRGWIGATSSARAMHGNELNLAWHVFANTCEYNVNYSFFVLLTTKCGGHIWRRTANSFLLWAFWLIFFEPVGNLLLIQGKLLRISNFLFRLKYFPKTPFLPYHHLLWAL